jgi:release factor glutamine methyltransferase
MSETWSVRRVLGWTAGYFERKEIDSPRLTAEVLLSHLLQQTRVQLYLDLDRPLSPSELTAYKALIGRRAAHEPTQYLTGTREFYNRPFAVDPRVLIPRPETELLVERVLSELPAGRPFRAVDLCTGSGCVAISLAAERPLASLWATDLSAQACEVAKANAQALEVAERVTILEGDLFAAFPADALFDAVVSNPPYVATNEITGLAPEVAKEPRAALDGGEDGLSVLRRIVSESRRWLAPGGLLALEIGDQQGPAALELLEAGGYLQARVEKDFARQDRVVCGFNP